MDILKKLDKYIKSNLEDYIENGAEELPEQNLSQSAVILKGLGGKDNIKNLDCCATRLRVTVIDSSLVDEPTLKQSGAAGVIVKGEGVQVIYGPRVTVIKSELEDYIATL